MARLVQQQRGLTPSLSRDPCPAADGTLFGDVVDFKVACGVDMPKSDLATVNADNFTHCMDICISSHPKCLGFVFDALGHFILDSAVATNVPTAEDDCAKLGPLYSAKIPGAEQDLQFQVNCGKYYAPGSLADVQASSMANCIDQCAQYNKDHSSPQCVAVAYESSQNYGYLNCYLKQSVETSRMAPNPNYKFDMALAVANPTSSGAVPTTAIATSPAISQPDTSSANNHSNGQWTSGSYVPSWVIGAVLGPILALVLVGLVVLYLRRKRRGVRTDQPQTRPSFKLTSASSSTTAPSRNNVMVEAPSPVHVATASSARAGELEAQIANPGELETYTPHTLSPEEENASRYKIARF
ncbi:hypothetical protein PG993_006026 [Apiospora rasikravindrae]|uniref:Apple domain-containing protein n=1 Tax=Apiospora rasikravindrae TaxID=990691 RepID=A0ABR1TC73_9PEZI